MPKTSQKKYIITIVILLLAQIVFLFAVKYMNQNLPFDYFSLAKTGNLFNLMIYAGIIIGIVIGIKKNKSVISNKSITTFLVVSWFMLIISFITTKVIIVPTNFYIYEQPGDKVLTGLLFLIFLLTLIYFLIFLWRGIFSITKPGLFRKILSTTLMLIFLLILTLIYIDNVGYASGKWILNKSKKNVAVVLGAAVWSGNIPSPTLSSRVDKALELLEQGFIGKIVFTGGKAPGELPEAEVAYEYARVKGVDTSKVIIETSTSSTADQIRWIQNNLLAYDSSFGEIILISDAYHLPRAIEISKFYNLDIKVAESVHKQNFRDKIANKIRESIALFNFWNFAL
ncbi:MAG: YdcF family protein [Ignavibacteriaceae bacterium]|jgi:vancomycin permeability regulator SanA|nr:YdcF family protein [Ignavibacteriaceae bacterium]MCU0413616.1 YdcF family protein [Ignavibacteriaceae bacterium]